MTFKNFPHGNIFVVPIGATSGARIVLDGTGAPSIRVYNSPGGIDVIDIVAGVNAGILLTSPSNGAKLQLSPDTGVGNPTIVFQDSTGFKITNLSQQVNGANTLLIASNNTYLATDGAMLAPAGYATNPFTLAMDPDVWNTLTLVNGWTGTLKYRAVLSPAKGIQILSSTLTPGTKADGTIVGTLPLGWRPSQNLDILGVVNTTIAGGQNPHFAVGSNGVITCWGWSAATVGSVNGIVATDF